MVWTLKADVLPPGLISIATVLGVGKETHDSFSGVLGSFMADTLHCAYQRSSPQVDR
jgi:hypothetical protein